jgi:hypothetical protein
MDKLLSKEDFNFYICVRKNISCSSFFQTNIGEFNDNPSDNLRNKITHMAIEATLYNYKIFNKVPRLKKYPNLKYLAYGGKIEFFYGSEYNELKVLLLLSGHIYEKEMENLPPNLEILAFQNFISLTINPSDFMLMNLPITLKKIIFIGDKTTDNSDFLTDLRKKLQKCKIPFGCNVYYVSETIKILDF